MLLNKLVLFLFTGFIVLVFQTVKAEPMVEQIAIFAGGCFWCTESDFDKVEGVMSTTSGYIGGHKSNPSYKEVSSGKTGHTEAVKLVFDPSKVSYLELLDLFWRSIDPTVKNAQFCDQGSQYRSGVFYLDSEQRKQAEASKLALSVAKPFDEPIVTEITEATMFYAAEDYHQNYHNRNPKRYKYYRWGCGRDKRLELLWGKR